MSRTARCDCSLQRVSRYIRRFSWSRFDRARPVTRAMERINPRSPPMTRSPHVDDKKGITVHDMQFPFERVHVPPPEPPFGPEGEAGSTCIIIDFVSCWQGLLFSIAENAI